MRKKIAILLSSILLLIVGCSKDAPAGWGKQATQIFNEHLYGYKLPYITKAEVSYEESIDSVVVASEMDEDNFESYVNKIVKDGFTKALGPFEDSYILLKDVIYNKKERTIDIDTYLSDGMMYAICYDPYVYSWPDEIIEYFYNECFYIKPSVTVPGVEADKYYVDTSIMESKGELTISCFTDINLENTYKSLLTSAGFILLQDKDSSGCYVAKDVQELVEVHFIYSEIYKIFDIQIKKFEGWPATVVDYYTDELTNNSGTRVPAVTGADSYEFIESSYDSHGYYFVSCPSKIDLEESYAEALTTNNYEVHNQEVNVAGNYYAISEKEDILVQYKYYEVESPFGGDPYKEISVQITKKI